MLYKAFMPFLNLITSFMLREFMRWRDGGKKEQTVKYSIPDYKKVWGGNEF